jgi:hypothetical protein
MPHSMRAVPLHLIAQDTDDERAVCAAVLFAQGSSWGQRRSASLPPDRRMRSSSMRGCPALPDGLTKLRAHARTSRIGIIVLTGDSLTVDLNVHWRGYLRWVPHESAC